MDSFGSRLKGLRVLHQKTQNDIAKLLGVRRETYTQWETGKFTPKHETLSWLASYFGVTTDYLLEGKNPSKTSAVKILGVVRAGEAILAQADEQTDVIEVPQIMIEPGAVYFGLRIVGDSMQDLGISEGMTVLVRQQNSIEDGQIAIVLLDGGEKATIKRCYKANGSLLLIPANSKHKEVKTPAERVKILGRVRYAISEF
jgi:repressor LexA